jgi:hypothetical protein
MQNFVERLGNMHLQVLQIITEAIGDINSMTTVDWDPFWFPEGFKGCLCDDACANYSVDLFNRFSKPNNRKIYDIFGYGEFHNCGPHPCARSYIGYNGKKVKVVNVSLLYTFDELDQFLSLFAGTETIVTFLIEDYHYSPEKAITLYRDAVETAVKYNVVCIPTYYPLDACKYSDDEIRGIYESFKEINTEYAQSLDLK